MMPAPDLKVVTLQESNFRDVPATLRVLADAIERGEHGEVDSLAVVFRGDKVTVCGLGIKSEMGETALLLQAGLAELVRLFA